MDIKVHNDRVNNPEIFVGVHPLRVVQQVRAPVLIPTTIPIHIILHRQEEEEEAKEELVVVEEDILDILIILPIRIRLPLVLVVPVKHPVKVLLMGTTIRPKIPARDCLRDGFNITIVVPGDPIMSKRPRDKRPGIDHREEEGPHPANRSLPIHSNNNHTRIIILRHPTIRITIHPTHTMDMEVEGMGNRQDRLRVVDQEEDREDKLRVPIIHPPIQDIQEHPEPVVLGVVVVVVLGVTRIRGIPDIHSILLQEEVEARPNTIPISNSKHHNSSRRRRRRMTRMTPATTMPHHQPHPQPPLPRLQQPLLRLQQQNQLPKKQVAKEEHGNHPLFPSRKKLHRSS